MKIEFINIVHAIIIWQSFLFAIILVTPKYIKNKGNKFLALFLLTLGLHFVYNMLLTNGLYLDILPYYSCCYGFLYGPLLFFYVRSRLRKDLVLKPIDYLHFLPFVIIIGLTTIGVRICNIAMYWVIPTMFLYCLLCFYNIKNYKKIIYQVSSNQNFNETKWIETLLVITIIVLIFNFIQLKISMVSVFGLTFPLEYIVQIGILILVNIITYQGLKNPQFFQQISTEDIQLNVVSKNKVIQPSQETIILGKALEAHMTQNELFLDPELDLTTLAKAMEVHPRTLSLTINQIFNYNFSEYINSKRITAAKSLLKDNTDDQLTIMEVMYNVGFNSRSVFNTLFKKKTGLTPSQFKAQLK